MCYSIEIGISEILRMQYFTCETILTFALIVDTRFIARTCIIVAAPNIAYAIVAYLIRDAVVIAIAYRFTNATVAPFVAQAIRITVKV